MAEKQPDRTQQIFSYLLANCLSPIVLEIKNQWRDLGRMEEIDITRDSIIAWRVLTLSKILYSSWAPPQQIPGSENAVRVIVHVQPLINNIPVGAGIQVDLELTGDRKIEISGWEELVAAHEMMTRGTSETGDPVQPAVIGAAAREREYQYNLPKVRQLLRSWGYGNTEVNMIVEKARNRYPTLSATEFEKQVIADTLKTKPGEPGEEKDETAKRSTEKTEN